ncbi:MAG TPA: hypothetical protein VFU15_07625 [Bacteroidia bacterium]|nr:hypothetical protein [Bacteroidia bacterium]
MKRIVRIHVILLLGVILLGGRTLHAQTAMYYNATLHFLQVGQVDSAKADVEKLMAAPGAKSDPDNWYLYGVVLKEMYKTYERNNFDSPYRKQSVDAFKTSLKLDTVADRKKVTRDNLRFIAGTFYNDAVTTLDTSRYKTSIQCYEQYREVTLIVDSTFDIKKKDIEFYLALASTYNTIYNLDKKKNAAFFDLTRDTYLKVLTWDPNNYMANYSMSLLYWNKGVDLMYNIDYDDSLTDVFGVQDHSVELFKQSLPFAEKAYTMEPNREETLIVLSGIYYSLNEFEKSKQYQQMLDDLRKRNPGDGQQR